MRRWIFALLGMAIAFPIPCLASIVIHDGHPGIIAHGDGGVLDSMGRVWQVWDNTWTRDPLGDPPVPTAAIKFWELWGLVTTDNEYWGYNPSTHTWTHVGPWPGLADVEGERTVVPESEIAPNPSSGPCRVSFHLASEAPVSVEIVDVAGRVVRRLLDSPHPAGDYSVIWDGRDDAGREMPSGVYWARIATAERTTTERIAVVK